MSGWEPYAQTLGPADATSAVISRFAGLQVVGAKITGTTPGADPDARACCWSHVIEGRPMSFPGWITGATACPFTPKGFSANGVFGPLMVGTGISVTASGGFYPDYAVVGAMEFLSIGANPTLGTSSADPLLPSWANPHAGYPSDPPTFIWDGTRFIEYQYRPFTSIEISVELGAPTIATAFTNFLTVRRRAYGDPPWTSGGAPGVPVMSMTVPAGASSATWSGSDTVPDPIAGATYAVGSNLVGSGWGGPGLPWGSGAGAAAAYAHMSWRVTVRRTGSRRTGVAPPLHQRQRTDGLGGGPMHQSPGLASRQLGGRARGIY